MSMTAIIPVRAGSRRVPHKNIRTFAGTSLLKIKINQLQRIPAVDTILVSSDSDVMLELARTLGVEAKHRPAEFCDEKSRTFNDLVEYVVENDVCTDDVIWTPCVCPLVRDRTIIEGIEMYEKIKRHEIEYDSLVSTIRFKEYLFDDYGKTVNFSVENLFRLR